MSTQPTDLHTRLSALLATVAPNPGTVATAQRERDRGILEALNDIVLRVEAIEAEKARLNKELELIRIQLAATAQITAVVASVNKTVESRITAVDQKSANRTATLVEALQAQDVETAVLRARIAEIEARK